MSKEDGATIWIVVPVGWSYDDQSYSKSGYDAPESCFTLKEMAEEWVKQKTVDRFREIALEINFSGYVTEDMIKYNISWEKYSQFWNEKTKDPEFARNYIWGNEFGIEEAYENFCNIWKINREDFRFDANILKQMTDDTILELSKELGLEFYSIYPARIYC